MNVPIAKLLVLIGRTTYTINMPKLSYNTQSKLFCLIFFNRINDKD